MSQIINLGSIGPTVATQFDTDAGSAIPALSILQILGGTNINTAGAGNAVTVNLDAVITLTTVNAITFDTNVAAAGVTLSGTTLSADGTDADININITAKGAGTVIIDELTLTTDLAVTEGGTGASSLTDHAVLVGSGTGAITAVGPGLTGQVLRGSTGADPSFGAVDLTTDVTGYLPVGSGGTGVGSVTAHALVIGDGTNALNELAVGATGETIMGSTGADCGWTGSPSFSGSVTAGTGLTVTTGNADISAGNLTLPTTSATAGNITINSVNALQMYGTRNFFAAGAGNYTLTTSADNIGIGSTALDSLTLGDYNIAIGTNAGTGLAEESNCIAIGYNCYSQAAGYGGQNIYIGSNIASVSSNNRNTSRTVAIGYNAMTKQSQNAGDAVYIGANCMTNVFGNHARNVFIGSSSGYNITGNGYPSSNTAYENTVIGHAALGISTGYPQGNICIGCYAGYALTGNEKSNILIGNNGVAADANTIRIGTNGSGIREQNKSYFAGIYGVTPAGTLNVALIDSNHQLGSVASLGVENGGTGAATLTDHAVLVGSGTGAITAVGPGSTGQVLRGSTGADPSFGAVDLTADVTGTLPVDNGGTGATTLTDHGILLGSGTGAITPLGEASNGQLPIGSTGADPVLATLTAGAGMSITNAAGSITIDNLITLNAQTDSYQLVLGDAGKLIKMNKASANTLTIPKDATVDHPTGTQILIMQYGAGATTIAAEDGTITIRYDSDLTLVLNGQYALAACIKIDDNEWVCGGNLQAA